MSIKAKVGTAVLAAGLGMLAFYEGTGPVKQTASGPVYHAYKDAVGVNTICHGHTAGVKMGQTATDDMCKQWLMEDLNIAVESINKNVKVDLTEYQTMALASFIYNVGGGAFSKSTMLKRINEGKFCAAAAEFPRWNKAGKVVLDGLTKRRYAEQDLFVEGYLCPSLKL